MSSLNCDRQQLVRAALRIVTGTYTRGRVGWPDIPWTLVFPQSATIECLMTFN